MNIKTKIWAIVLLAIVVIIAIFFLKSEGDEHNYHVTWIANTEPDMHHYNLFWWHGDTMITSKTFTFKKTIAHIAGITNYDVIVPDIRDGWWIQAALTAIDTAGNESIKSYTNILKTADGIPPGAVKEPVLSK